MTEICISFEVLGCRGKESMLSLKICFIEEQRNGSANSHGYLLLSGLVRKSEQKFLLVLKLAVLERLVQDLRGRISLCDGPGHGRSDHLLTNEHIAEHLTHGHGLVCKCKKVMIIIIMLKYLKVRKNVSLFLKICLRHFKSQIFEIEKYYEPDLACS